MRQSLKKLYYQGKDLYDAVYKNRFENESSTRLDFEIHGYPAFFVWTKDITSKLMQIMENDKLVSKVLEKLPGVAIEEYQTSCLIDEIVLTNDIEGVRSTRREIANLLDDYSKQNNQKRFAGIVQKYRMLLSSQSSSQIKLNTCQDIREIYDSLLSGEVEKPDGHIFRKDSVSVYSSTDKEIHRGVYPEFKIIKSMEKALLYLNTSSDHLLLKISVFHYLFGYIHPFYDGNGRTSRFISAYLMTQCLEPLVSFRLSYAIKRHIHGYYEAFMLCNDPLNRGEITSFIEMFLSVTLSAVRELKDGLEDRAEQMNMFFTLCESFPECSESSKLYWKLYQLLIQAALFSETGISTSELCRILTVSDSTLRKKLDVIKKRGLLLTRRYGYSKFYQLDMDIFHKKYC